MPEAAPIGGRCPPNGCSWPSSAASTIGFPSAATDADAAVYLESLHADDLALACACIDGHDGAWEHFIRELRPQLYHAARTIAGDDGRELADSLYGELFGLPGKDGNRRSLLVHYHGRSRLITWLRSVLVQRHIDRVRVTRRFEPLDDGESGGSAQRRRPRRRIRIQIARDWSGTRSARWTRASTRWRQRTGCDSASTMART